MNRDDTKSLEFLLSKKYSYNIFVMLMKIVLENIKYETKILKKLKKLNINNSKLKYVILKSFKENKINEKYQNQNMEKDEIIILIMIIKDLIKVSEKEIFLKESNSILDSFKIDSSGKNKIMEILIKKGS